MADGLKRVRGLLVFLFLLAAPSVATGEIEGSLPDVLRHTAPSVVQIRIGDFWGSGFVYPTARHVVTSFSVVNQSGDLTVALRDGSVQAARVVAWSEVDDLALLELTTPASAPPLRLSTVAPYAGQPLVLFGYPFRLNPGEDPPRRLDVPPPRFGRVAVVYAHRLQADVLAWQGDPGAPLLAPSGDVIAVVTLSRTAAAVVPAARANRIEWLASLRGTQGAFEPHPPAESGQFLGFFATPVSTNGLVGAGIEIGYRHGWLQGSLAVGGWLSSFAPQTTGSFERQERFPIELRGAAQVPFSRGGRFWLGPGVTLFAGGTERWTPNGTGGFTKSQIGRAGVHPLLEFGFAAGPLFMRDVFDLIDPALRLDIGVMFGR